MRPLTALVLLGSLSLTTLFLAACGSSSSAPAASGSAGAAGAGGTGTGGATSAGGANAAGAAGSGGEAGAGEGLGDYDPTPIGGTRPTLVYVPTGYRASHPAPVVILLHGYGVSGLIQEALFQVAKQAETAGFLYAHPDGLVDASGKHFWNATDACCDFGPKGVDDSAYLAGLVTEIASRWSVDPKRVYFIGHSNGGYMAHRMACDHADTIAAVMSLAGAMWADTSKCKPAAPISVLQIHGTIDDMVAYDGTATYPSAKKTVEDWAAFDGCSLTPDTSLPPLDLDESIPGDESTITKYAAGCKGNADVELWTIPGGMHVPGLSKTFLPDVVGFLLAHPKP